MSKSKVILGGLVVVAGVLVFAWRPVLFQLGGGFVSAGHSMQEAVDGFERSGEVGTPQQVLERIEMHNSESSTAKKILNDPRQKPEALIVMCVDPRLDAKLVLGDTRDYYDVVRMPGSILNEEIMEAIELGVAEHTVKVVVFTTHTDCAMEGLAHSDHAGHFPALSKALLEREKTFEEFMQRPLIAKKVAAGELIVKRFRIDTVTSKLMPENAVAGSAPVEPPLPPGAEVAKQPEADDGEAHAAH
ncbi:MAG: hypothetical protein H6730_31400 [Deltaproteobacteria bacterium]|nr:hypothetical protein [Deltaproteobacteria bacterium]